MKIVASFFESDLESSFQDITEKLDKAIDFINKIIKFINIEDKIKEVEPLITDDVEARVKKYLSKCEPVQYYLEVELNKSALDLAEKTTKIKNKDIKQVKIFF